MTLRPAEVSDITDVILLLDLVRSALWPNNYNAGGMDTKHAA